ncbi:MAG: hypothetical protein RBR68_15100 [Tenuifilaceae bacterium]|jgi:hypothetical protein|nr:hypothetical protein [Tenuifilaceae bacterium]
MRAIFVDALYLELSSGITVITDPGVNSRVCFKYNGRYLTEEITGKEANEFGFISDFTVSEYIDWLKKANDMTVIDEVMVIEWADGTWVFEEDYRSCDWTHMSDDYVRVTYNPNKHY